MPERKSYLEKKVRVGTDENGNAKYKSVYGKNKRELNQKVKALEDEVLYVPFYYQSYDSFQKWGERWYKYIGVHGNRGRNIGHTQMVAYRGYLKHFYNTIGDIPLNEITREDIQDVIDSLFEMNPNTGKPTAKKTLTDIKGVAVKVFDFAIDNEAINKNPAKKVAVPAMATVSERRPLTAVERKMIEDTPNRRGIDKNGKATDEYGMQVAAMIMLYAGLRRGEVIALLWDDVDLDKGTINVNKAADVSENIARNKSTKTKAGNRIVHIHPILKTYLKKIRKNRRLKSEYVCPSLDGGMFSATSWRTGWNCYMQDLDVKYGKDKEKTSKYQKNHSKLTIDIFTPHCLRHTFGTMLNDAGVNIKTIQTELGHSDIRTTMNRYVHDSAEHCANEMKKYFKD